MDTAFALTLWLEALTAEGRSPQTLDTYRRMVRDLPSIMSTLDSPEGRFALRRALAALRGRYAPESVRTYFVAWHSFFAWCVEDGLIDASPMSGMRSPKVPEHARDAYSLADMRRLFAHLATLRTPVGLRNHAICALLLDCGLRASELCRLEMGDSADGLLIIRETKSGRPRVAPLGNRAGQALGRYVQHGRPKLHPDSTRLFVNQFGHGIDRHGLRQILERLGESASVDHLYAHKFRHTWATGHLRAGTSTDVLRRLAGWSGESMVKRYAHLLSADLVDAQRRASPLDHIT